MERQRDIMNIKSTTASFQQQSLSDLLQDRARHIAGHAVMALAEGVDVRFLTIAPARPAFSNEDGLWIDQRTLVALSEQWPAVPSKRMKLAETIIRISLAGSVAQHLLENGPDFPIKWKVCSEDWKLAWTTAEMLYVDKHQREEYLTTCLQRLHTFLSFRQYYDQVLLISDALVEQNELDEAALKALLNENHN